MCFLDHITSNKSEYFGCRLISGHKALFSYYYSERVELNFNSDDMIINESDLGYLDILSKI